MFAGRKASSALVGTRSAMLDLLCSRLPMVRLRATRATLALAAVALATGCTGDILNPTGDPLEVAIGAFDRDVAPLLNSKCGTCHTAADKPQFMKPDPTLREGVLKYKNAGGTSLVNLMDPISSRLQVYSSSEAHIAVGTNFSPAEAAKVTAWIELEALAAGVVEAPEIKTNRLAPVIGPNKILLDSIGLIGSEFSFSFERITTGYYLSNIKIKTAAGGAHVVSPLFVIWEGENPVPDPINRFAGIDLVIAENTESQVGGGTAIFTYPGAVPAQPQISVHFKTVSLANGMPTTPGGGDPTACKAVAKFMSDVAPLFQPAVGNCLRCHGTGGMPAAMGATNMTKIGMAGMEAEACGQILTRVSKANPNQSSIIVSVDPGVANVHTQAKVPAAAFTDYKNKLIGWITAEAAP